MVLLLNVNIAQKHTVYISDTLADTLSNCFVFQLPAIKLIEMLANCAITNMETISPMFIYGDVMLQTNPDITSHFLNS